MFYCKEMSCFRVFFEPEGGCYTAHKVCRALKKKSFKKKVQERISAFPQVLSERDEKG